MKRLRVIQWATGKVGKFALRAILDDSRLELVGVYAYSADKAGRDGGELCGRPNCGINATSNVEALLALGADCLIYTPLHPDASQLARFLESGTNVVSTALFGREGALAGAVEKLEEACVRGHSSLFITGVNPGWANSIAVAMTGVCSRIDSVTISESADCSHYASLETWLAHGISMPNVTDETVENTRNSLLPFADAVRQMAQALEINIEEMRFEAEHAMATKAVDLGWLKIEAGTIAGVRASWSGLSGGHPVLTSRTTWYMTRDLDVDWNFSDDHYHISVHGDPGVEARVRWVVPTNWTGKEWGTLTALPAVSAVSTVCAARPGLLSLLDLGLPHAPVGVWN